MHHHPVSGARAAAASRATASALTAPPSATPGHQPLQAGTVSKLLPGPPKPFGFITPAGGGPSLYFNEAQLGHELTWLEFCGIAAKYDDCTAPVCFRTEVGRGDKPQAVGVVPLATEGSTDAELQAYLALHPGLLAARSLTKWELRQQQQQAEWEARQAANAQKHQEWKQRKAETAARQQREWEARQAAHMAKRAEWEARQAQKAREHQQREVEYRTRRRKDEADNASRTQLKQRHDAEERALRAQYDECWDQIRALQAQQKREVPPQQQQQQQQHAGGGPSSSSSWKVFNQIKAEIAALHVKKDALHAQEVALDHKHDVEMFERALPSRACSCSSSVLFVPAQLDSMPQPQPAWQQVPLLLL